MFDIGGFLIEENSDRLSMQSKYLSQFLEAMNDKDLLIIFRVSGILLSYHYEKLSKYDLGKAHVYNCQSWVKELYDFDRYHYELMNDEDFMKGFEDANNLILERTGKQSNLSLYRKVIIDKGNYWLDLIMQLTHDGDFSIDFRSETLYNWILSLRKKDRTLVNGVGFAATEILTYPAIIENHKFHTYFPYYALIADEFSPEGFNNLESALINYSSKSEVQVALLKRIGNIPEAYYIDDSKQYLSAFSPNNSTNILKRNKEDLEKIFLESQVIPNSVIDYIESIIFFDPYDTNELEIKKDEGNISKIIISIVLFCKESKVDFSTILKALDKTGWYFNRSSIESVLGESIYIIKEIMIQDEKYRNSYTSEIKQNILDQKGKIGNNVIDNFNELFALDDNIEINYLKILFEELLNYPYYLNLSLMYTIFNFIIKKLDYSDYEILSKEIENHIKTLKNKGFRNGMEDNIIPLLWMFSLIAFFIDGEKRDYSSYAFLRGIESIFIIKTDRQYLNVNKEKMKISSRDLLIHSECIFQRIQSNVIKSAFIQGTMNAEPEIKSLCLMLQAFANR